MLKPIAIFTSLLLCFSMSTQNRILSDASDQTVKDQGAQKEPVLVEDNLEANRKSESLLSDQEFHYFEFNDLTYFLNKLMLVRNLIKIYSTADEFPDMNQSLCGEAVCKNYFMEVANFSLGRARINRLPVILLVAGLNGDETLGISTLVHFLDRVAFLNQHSDDWFRIFNSVRFVVVPFANVSGFAVNKPHEKVRINGKNAFIDPKTDFNWKNKDACFRTATAEMLFRIQQRYLVTAALVFSGGESQIVYPMQPSPSNRKQQSSEKPALEFAAQVLAQVAKPTQASSASYSKYRVTGLESLSRASDYLMWLYGASEVPGEAKLLCFSKNKKFRDRYAHPTQSSNRVFALEVSLERSVRPKAPLGRLGGIINGINDAPEDFGSVVRTFRMIKSFAMIVRPFAEVSEVRKYPAEKTVKLEVGLSGCVKVADISFLNHKEISPQLEIGDRKMSDKPEAKFKLLYNFGGINKPETMSTPVDLRFGVTCDSEIYRLASKSKPISLLVRQKTQPETFEWNKQYIENLQFGQITLSNVNLSLITHVRAFGKFYNEMTMVYNDVLAFSLGPYFPMTLQYDHEDSYVHLKFDSSRIAAPPEEADSRDIAGELGITNIRGRLRHSEVFNRLVGDMKEYWLSINLSTQRNVGRDNFVKPLTPLEQHLLNFDLEISSMTRDDINRRFGVTDDYLRNYSIAKKVDGTSRFENFHLLMIRSSRACFNYFMNLVGSRGTVRVIRKSKDRNVVMSNFLKSLAEMFRTYLDFHLSGEIMFYNPLTMGPGAASASNYVVDSDAFKKMAPIRAFKLWNSGVLCTSLEQTMTIKTTFDADLVRRARQSEYFRAHPDFYGISLEVPPSDPSKVLLRLLVESERPRDKYVLHNKAQAFELVRTDKDELVRIEGLAEPVKLAKYQLLLEYEEVQFIGTILKLFDKSGQQLLFDCFLENMSLVASVKNRFTTYMGILRQVMEPRLFEHFYNGAPILPEAPIRSQQVVSEETEIEEHVTQRKDSNITNWIYVVIWVMLLLILVGTVYYMVRLNYFQKNSSDDNPEQTLTMQIAVDQEPGNLGQVDL